MDTTSCLLRKASLINDSSRTRWSTVLFRLRKPHLISVNILLCSRYHISRSFMILSNVLHTQLVNDIVR